MLLPFWWTLRAFVAPLALVFPPLRTTYGRWFLQDRSGRDLAAHPEVIACAQADLKQAFAHTIVAYIVLSQDLPFFWYYLVPWVLAGLLNAHRVVAEHVAENVTVATRENMAASAKNNDVGWILNSFLYPHNIGFHETHHRVPTASFTHLKTLHTALLQPSDATTN